MTLAGRLTGALTAVLSTFVVSGLLLASVGASPSSAFTTGFADSIWDNPATSNLWFGRLAATGGKLVLQGVSWASVSPSRPPRRTDPSDPANPAYDWGSLDTIVRAATAHGLTVAFTVAGGGGPSWADGPHRPRGAQPGTWRPDPVAFSAFAKALARRYSGSFNPGTGTLPRVRYYQGWSEPNLSNHLTPQWVRVRGHWTAESPIIYRGLLNAFYDAVKSVHRSNLVVTGGTAPFGDQPGGKRVPPALFVRELLCLHGQRLTPLHCPNPARFDILAHHPYAIGGPFQPAFDVDDVSVPDLGKLTRPLAAAERTGRVFPRRHKQVWVTEFSWDSNPPDPQGIPVSQRARWIREAFYVLWRQRVDAIAWFLLADQPPIPNYASSYQSGIYFVNGRPKPDLEAFRFPFVVEPASHGRKLLWGISPRPGRLLVQRLHQRAWVTILSFNTPGGIFTQTLAVSSGSVVRATVGGETSLQWPVR